MLCQVTSGYFRLVYISAGNVRLGQVKSCMFNLV